MKRDSVYGALAGIVFLLAVVTCAAAQTLVQEELRIPMRDAGPQGLEALLVKAAGTGRHPLALINHGSPRDPDDRANMTPEQMLPQLDVFARRGFTAVAVMRRGFGTSGGDFSEGIGSCSDPNYLRSVVTSAADLRAAIAELSRRDDVDPTRIVSVGASAGGFATVALTVDPPSGLVAAVSFAGARGSPSSDHVCSPDALVAAFKELGARSRVPMLWIFAVNDHFFGPALAARLRQIFVAGGGDVSFVQTPPFGADGHTLFSQAGMSVWVPLVDDFLDKRGLKLMAQPLAAPPPPKIEPPAQLGADGREAFGQYLSSAPHKAFAVASDGSFGWRTARRTEDDARRGAMDNCGNRGATDCRVLAVDDGLVDE